jgi:prephenate dehydratase
MAKNNINLTSIQSKPPKFCSGKRTMNFHIDFVGTYNDENVLKCTADLKNIVVEL